MRTTTNFEEFMSYIDWDELDINEKRALLDAARSITNLDMGLFRTELQSELEDKTIVWYPLGEIGLILDIPARINFIKYIENTYMYGEDSDAYLSWLAEIGGKKIFNPFLKETITRPLPINEQCVVKRISIGKKLRTRLHIATIVYARSLSNMYNTRPENENIIVDNAGNRYPHDELDKCIYKSIEKTYKDALLTTEFLIYDSEKKRDQEVLNNFTSTQIRGQIILSRNLEELEVEYPEKIFSFNLKLYTVRKETLRVFENFTIKIYAKNTEEYNLLSTSAKNSLTLL
jgi:hypothetical protein